MQNLREELTQILQNSQFQIKHTVLIKKYIFNSAKFQQFLKRSENFRTNCAKTIKKSKLAFSCATCGVDNSHLICSDCFDVNLHQNHKCVITKSSGSCDCGDEEMIKPEGMCLKHKQKKIDANEIIKQIPLDLRQNIEHFLIIIMELYMERMNLVRIDLKAQSNIIVKIYHQCIKQNKNLLQQIIEEHFNLKEYYKLLQQAFFLHSLFIDSINLLVEKKYNFIILIQQLFQQPQSLLLNKSMFECLYENQVLLESQFPEKCKDLEKLLKIFTCDLQFCKFSFNFYILKQKHIFLFVPQILKPNKHQELSKFYEKVLKNPSLLCLNYFDILSIVDIKTSQSKQFLLMYQSPIFGSTEYLHQDLLEYLFSTKSYQKQIQDNAKWLKQIQNKITVNKTLTKIMAGQILNIIYSQNFHNAALNELKLYLGQSYEEFCRVKNLEISTLMLENREDFFLSCILNSFKIQFKENFQLRLGKVELIAQFSDAETFITEVTFIASNFIKAFAAISPSLVKEAKNNLINLLFYQSYYLIKNFKNPNDNFDQQLHDRVEKFVTTQDLTKKNAINRCTLIYLKSLKQDTVVDKIFTFLLGLLYYNHDFSDSSQFLQFLSDFLKEEIQIIQQQLQKILQRCLQTLLAMWFHKNKSLHNLYLFGLKTERIVPPQSFDYAFLRIYLYLFPQEGIKHVRSCISKINIPRRIFKEFEFERYLIEKIFSSEIDMINLYGEIFSDFPSELQLSLAKTLCNYTMITKHIKCENLYEELKAFGILIVSIYNNGKTQILNVCSLDDLKYNYIVNEQYKPSFDKFNTTICPGLYNEILDFLIQKKSPDYLITFGNSIQWDLEFFSKPVHRKIFKNFLQYYSSEEAIHHNLQVLKKEENCCKSACSLLYKQVVAAHYFQGEQFLTQLKNIQTELELSYQILSQKRENYEDLQVLIRFVQSLLSEPFTKIDEENPQQAYQKGKNKYIKKYEQLQKQVNSEQLQVVQNLPNIEEEKPQNICQFCRQDLKNDIVFMPIYVTKRKIISTLVLLPDWITNELINSNGEIFIATSCMHQQHAICFSKIENEQISTKGYFTCPICQVAFFIQWPIYHSLSDEAFDCLIYQITDNFNCLCDREMYNQLIDFFLLLLISQLGQAFQNPFNYVKKGYLLLFRQILKTTQFFKISPWDSYIINKQKLIKIYSNESIIAQLIYLIEDSILTKQDDKLFQLQIIGVISKCPDESMKQLLIQLFEVDYIEMQSDLINPILQKEIVFYKGLQKSIEQQIINILGRNFQEFHFKYFPKVCSVCNFFNKIQNKDSDLFVCLLCQKIFCNYQCKESNSSKGNLSMHAEKEHCGISFFISLSTGNCTVVDSPNSILDYLYFFINDQGFQIEIEKNYSNWEDYQLQLDAVQNLASSIANNSYQQCCFSNETENMQSTGFL